MARMPEIPGISAVPAASGVLGMHGAPELSDVPEVSAVSGAPGVLAVPAAPPGAGPRADVAAFERLTQALVGITTQSLDALDGAVTVSQFRLLRTLDGLGRVSCTTLATALGTAASSVTRLVDKLVAAGFVARGADPHSRSIVTVEVTSAGRKVITSMLARRRALLEAVLDAISPGARERAAAAAERFVLLAGDAVATGAGVKGPVAL